MTEGTSHATAAVEAVAPPDKTSADAPPGPGPVDIALPALVGVLDLSEYEPL